VTLQEHEVSKERRQTFGVGLLKGMGVTLKHLFKHNTVIQYPDQKQDLPARTRGVIALKEENCTVCMLCGRECPDWCIYIDSHKETLPPKREGGRPRKRNVLDRFAIDYALCMYCGICVEVCPYDALFWSREFEYAEYDIRELTHEKERLSDWMTTVLPPPELEDGAELPGQPAAAAGAAGPGSAQRPSPPAQVTATEERPQQAPRAPEPAAPAAPSEAQASAAQRQAGETRSEEPTPSAAEATEQRSEAVAASAGAPEPAAPTGTGGIQPEGLRARAERVPAEGGPAPGADPEESYRRVLSEQLAKGSSPQVAEARARVARVKAQRGLTAPVTPPVEGATVPSGAPRARQPQPEQGPVAPVEATAAESEAPDTNVDPDPASGESAAASEDPDAVYERVLASERAKGSSDAVAVARAKAARVRATKGTKGPQD
jgi:formate hydrogenlyase subunit 6/NADH:ubiquinone oxidoreductase subunit I